MQLDPEGEDINLLTAMAEDPALDENTKKRTKAILAYLRSNDIQVATQESELSINTVRKVIGRYREEGWQALISIRVPRGGDFLARYDQGYWAEKLIRNYLDTNTTYRCIQYGTSRSEPFTDMRSFREFALNELMLQAWSSGQRWKRPDLIMLPRGVLKEERGNARWTPDLIHWDNTHCAPYIAKASAAIEVETSLWQVSITSVTLSFTVKDEDLQALRAWIRINNIPLYIVQVFYDQVYALAFATLEFLLGQDAPPERRVSAKVDRLTGKQTYMVPLSEGIELGSIPEPDVEGRVFKADNGRVTVYGRLTGSCINGKDPQALASLAEGSLKLEQSE